MSWPRIPLGELCSLITDGKHGDCLNQAQSEYYFLSAKDVYLGNLNYSNARQISRDGFEETHRRTDLRPGDVLITNLGTIGRLAVARDDPKTYRTTFQKSVAVLKPIYTKINSKYLYYQLMSSEERLVHSSGGAAQKNLLLSTLRLFEIPVPDLEEQERVVSILSVYDDLIENNRRRIALLEEAARQLYKEWFVRFRFPGHAHVKILDGVPEEWERQALAQIAEIVMGQSPKSNFYNAVSEGLPFHQGVTDYGFRFVSHRTYSTYVTKLAEPFDILLSVRAPVGRINITRDRIVLGRGLSAIRSKTKNQSFLLYALKEHFYAEDIIGTGSIYAATNKKELESQMLLIPSEKLIRSFEDYSAPIDRQIANLARSVEHLIKARDLLLPKLMSGAITV